MTGALSKESGAARAVSILRLLFLAAVALLAAAFFFQRRLIYFPARAVGDPRALGLEGVEDARFRADDGVALHGWFAPARGRDRGLAVLVCHGNGGNVVHRAHLLERLPEAGLSALVFDYRGYGLSADAGPTEDGLYRDGAAALAFLLERTGLPARRAVLFGESLGAAVAVELAARLAPDAPHALVLESPFTSLADVAARHYPFLPARLLLRDRYESAAKIAAVRAPILVVHGALDTLVPPEQGRALADRATAPSRFVLVPGAGHNDLWADERARLADVAAFLDSIPPR